MIEILFTLFALAAGAQPEHGIASVFGGSSDKHRGGKAPCLSPPRRVRANDWGVATRDGKCGDLYAIILPRTRRIVIAPRIDAGPYGSHDRAGNWEIAPKVSRRRRRPRRGYRYRGITDLTRPVSNALGHNRFERVWVVPLRGAR